MTRLTEFFCLCTKNTVIIVKFQIKKNCNLYISINYKSWCSNKVTSIFEDQKIKSFSSFLTKKSPPSPPYIPLHVYMHSVVPSKHSFYFMNIPLKYVKYNIFQWIFNIHIYITMDIDSANSFRWFNNLNKGNTRKIVQQSGRVYIVDIIVFKWAFLNVNLNEKYSQFSVR